MLVVLPLLRKQRGLLRHQPSHQVSFILGPLWNL